MKKIIIYLSLSCFFINLLSAQESARFKRSTSKDEFYFGVRAGLGAAFIFSANEALSSQFKNSKKNTNTVDFEDGSTNTSNQSSSNQTTNKTSAVFSHTAGVYAGYKFSEALSLQAELLYARGGVNYEHSFKKSDTVTTDGKKRLNLESREIKLSLISHYIDMPVVAQYNFPSGIYIEGGPQLSFLVGKNYNYSKRDPADNKNPELNTFDFKLAAGAGYRFNDKWDINLRYTQGFSNVIKDTKDSTKNGAFQLSAAYTF